MRHVVSKLVFACLACAALVGFTTFAGKSGGGATDFIPHSVIKGSQVTGTINNQPVTKDTMLLTGKLGATRTDAWSFGLDELVEVARPYAEADWSATVPEADNVARILTESPLVDESSPDEIAAFQAAIWHFTDGFDLDSTANATPIVERYTALLERIQRVQSVEGASTLEAHPQRVDGTHPGVHLLTIESSTPQRVLLNSPSRDIAFWTPVNNECSVPAPIEYVVAPAAVCVAISAEQREPVQLRIEHPGAAAASGRVFVRTGRQRLVIPTTTLTSRGTTIAVDGISSTRTAPVSINCPLRLVHGGRSTFTSELGVGLTDQTVSYLWQLNGRPIGGNHPSVAATVGSADILTVSVSSSEGIHHTATLGNCAGQTTPIVTPQCVNGATPAVSIQDADSGDHRVRWQVDGAPIEAEGPRLDAVPSGSRSYTAIVSDPDGNTARSTFDCSTAPEATMGCPISVPATSWSFFPVTAPRWFDLTVPAQIERVSGGVLAPRDSRPELTAHSAAGVQSVVQNGCGQPSIRCEATANSRTMTVEGVQEASVVWSIGNQLLGTRGSTVSTDLPGVVTAEVLDNNTPTVLSTACGQTGIDNVAPRLALAGVEADTAARVALASGTTSQQQANAWIMLFALCLALLAYSRYLRRDRTSPIYIDRAAFATLIEQLSHRARNEREYSDCE